MNEYRILLSTNGRTIPSLRIASVQQEKEWKAFRQALDKKIGRHLTICFQLLNCIIQLVLMLLNL
jgi:hypothetical protein